MNWTIVSYPTEGWAKVVFGEPDVEIDRVDDGKIEVLKLPSKPMLDADARKKLRDYTMDARARSIQAAMLIGYGADDRIMDPQGAYRSGPHHEVQRRERNRSGNRLGPL